jgi:hypothetical protein
MIRMPARLRRKRRVRFVLDNIIWVSIATIIIALGLAVFIVWFFHKIFPEKPSTTAMASSVASLIFIVLIGYGLNNIFGLKRDRDSRLFGLQQQHLSQLRPVLKLESDRLRDLSSQFQTTGLLITNDTPITSHDAIAQQLTPDVMSSDLANHYPTFVRAKEALIDKVVSHDRNFENAIVEAESEERFSDTSWFTKRLLAITFIQQCTGMNSGFVLNSAPSTYSFSLFGRSQGVSGSPSLTVPNDLLGAYRKYKRFRPSPGLQAQCNSLRESSHYIADSAQDLSKQALLLAQKMTLQGDCDFIKLD